MVASQGQAQAAGWLFLARVTSLLTGGFLSYYTLVIPARLARSDPGYGLMRDFIAAAFTALCVVVARLATRSWPLSLLVLVPIGGLFYSLLCFWRLPGALLTSASTTAVRDHGDTKRTQIVDDAPAKDGQGS